MAIPIPIFRILVLQILTNFTRTYSRTLFLILTRTCSVPVLQFSKCSVAVPYSVPIFKFFRIPYLYLSYYGYGIGTEYGNVAVLRSMLSSETSENANFQKLIRLTLGALYQKLSLF